MTTLVIASRLPLHRQLADALRSDGHDVTFVGTPEELEIGHWRATEPAYLFFPHWSHRIPAEIHTRYECVIFHMADLPRGRGGSPLQNHIVQGVENTFLCALRCTDQVDAGPVYLRRPLGLLGTADEILMRAAELMLPMIREIVQERPVPQAQEGEPTVFRRRRPEDGNIAGLAELRQVFDHIRMLDGQGYPPAYLETEHLVLEFSRASLKEDHVVTDVRIRRKSS